MEIVDIILKSLLEKLSPEEDRRLKQWQEEAIGNCRLYDKILNSSEFPDRIQLWMELNSDKAYKQTMKRINENQRRRTLRKIMPYAAILILGLFFSLFYFYNIKSDPHIQETSISSKKWQAELVLANGEKISLEEFEQVALPLPDEKVNIESNIVQYKKGRTESQTNEFHTIRTPLGGSFVLILSDETKVYLNSMSIMEYPVQFSKNERRVKLSGQAYFEVNKDTNAPFIVETEGYEIQVLGTSFDVKCYEDDTDVRTTLCDGKVKIIQDNENSTHILPGQQFSMDVTSRETNIEKVDTDLFTSWVYNNFHFSNNTLQDIFTELSRWYNIEVIFKNPDSRFLTFSGKFSRSKNIETILDVMQTAGIILETNDKQIIIR